MARTSDTLDDLDSASAEVDLIDAKLAARALLNEYLTDMKRSLDERCDTLPVAVDDANRKGPGQQQRQEFAAVRRAEMVLLERIHHDLTKILG